MAKGLFARVGIVSFDRNGKVLIARSPDLYSKETLPQRVTPKGDRAVENPFKLSCLIGPVRYIPSEKIEVKGIGSLKALEGLEATITLKNAGQKAIEIKHDAARGMVVFLIVGVYFPFEMK